MPDRPTITIENAKLIFKNFSGAEGPFNRKGQRSFCVLLEDDNLVKQLEADGWNVKYTKPREEGDEPEPYLPVEVKFENFPPSITQITSSGKTRVTEDMVETLDWSDFKLVDLVVNPYDWTMPNGDSGRKAYLKTMFVTLNEDDLERKYALMERDERQRDE